MSSWGKSGVIKYEKEYLDFIQRRGVGDNDEVASSPASYVSYLNSVSELLRIDISPQTAADELAVTQLLSRLRGRRAAKTIQNYGSALRQYVAMVQELRLR